MKKIILICIIAFGVQSCASYEKVVTVKEDMSSVYDDLNGTKNQLFLKANEWMVNTFNNAESVIQYSDKDEGAIIGKYLMFGELISVPMGMTVNTRVFAIIDIRVKDNKARVSIKPAETWTYNPKSGRTIYSFSPENFKEEANELKENIHTSLKRDNIEF